LSNSLKHFSLKKAKVSFNDESLKPKVKTKLDDININAYNIDSKEKSYIDYDFFAKLNSKGSFKSKGKISHTPLSQNGILTIDKISLKEFSPYIEKQTYLKLNDGYLSLKSKVKYAKSDVDSDLEVSGRLDIDEFFLNNSKDNSALFSFNNMALKSFRYKMFPDEAFINELDINSFYINALIDENQTLNLASLVKENNNTIKKDKVTKKTKFPFRITKLNITSGSAKFADLSLPIKFKTDIHDLNGAVYSISNENNEISYVDISGEIDKYGSTKLEGSVESSNVKSYTDLNFNFRNLDLNSLSGYSADFAGYKIDEGKLCLDLGYKINNNKLLGKNSIIIKKIKLGDEIKKDENSSSLPLGFAIALLEDSDGIIDIDMPVHGNVDEPDFKYGALLWKTFGKLILKAVASPFKFLGSMMGLDGEKLKYIEFEPGSTKILAPEREKLDNITKMMIKRPKILLNITSTYDKKQDLWMMKQEKLIILVTKKSGIKNKKDRQNIMNISLLEDIYKTLAPTKDPLSIKKLLEKQYKGKILQRVYLQALIKETTKMQIVLPQELEDLATKRASVLKEYLVRVKGLDDEKIILHNVKNIDENIENFVRTQVEIMVK